MTLSEYLLWAALLIGVGASLALYASQPHLRGRIKIVLAALGGAAAGLITLRLTRRAPQLPPPAPKKTTSEQAAPGSAPRTSPGDAPTPRPHETDHAHTPSDRPSPCVPVAYADADDIKRYIERAKRDGGL